MPTVSVPPSGMARTRVVTEVPEHLFDLVGVHARPGDLPIERANQVNFLTTSGFALHQHERFLQQSADVFFLERVGLLPGIVQEIRDDVVQAFGFPADDADQVLLVFLKGHEPPKFLHSAGDGSERLANLVSNGGGEAPDGSHAFLGGDFLLQVAKFRQILKIEDVPAAGSIARAKRRNGDAQKAALPARDSHLDFTAEGEPFRE